MLGAQNVFAASLDEEEKREAKIEFGERCCSCLRDWKYGNFVVHEATLILLIKQSEALGTVLSGPYQQGGWHTVW